MISTTIIIGLPQGYCRSGNIGIRKPWVKVPTSTGMKLYDSKCFGGIMNLCNAFAVGDEDNIKLDVILSDERQHLKDWVELVNGKEIHGLGNYRGEADGSIAGISLHDLNMNTPKYIYFRKH